MSAVKKFTEQKKMLVIGLGLGTAFGLSIGLICGMSINDDRKDLKVDKIIKTTTAHNSYMNVKNHNPF